MSKLIVIVGATGNQGGSVAEVFLRDAGWTVRGITRNPNKPTNKHLIDAGIELVAADLDDKVSLQKAFMGATVIFGVTDFWQNIQDPNIQKLVADTGISINQAAFDRELQQAKNIIDAAAAVGPSLKRFVFSTLSDTKEWSNGTITWNFHFDAKAAATKYLQATHAELAKKTNYLQVGFYMSNWQMAPPFSPRKQADGNFAVRAPSVPNPKPLPWVFPRQDCGHFVKALETAPAATVMLGYSKLATMQEFCDLWTRILRERGLIEQGVACNFDGSMTIEELDEMMPGGLGREIGESCLYSAKYGFDGGDPDVKSPSEIGVDVASLSSLEEYIRTTDWSSIL